MKNQFLVDLDAIKLSDAQVKSIDSAIQKAVSAELAKITTIGKIKLVPPKESDGPGSPPRGGVIMGLVAHKD